MTRKEVAQLRLRAAAEHVEKAQHELERAVSALASLNWMHPEQLKVATLRDRLHEMFYRLAPTSYARAKACAKAELDREVGPGDDDPHKGCCPGYNGTVRGGMHGTSLQPVRPVLAPDDLDRDGPGGT